MLDRIGILWYNYYIMNNKGGIYMNVDVKSKMSGIERLLDVVLLNLEDIQRAWTEDGEEGRIRLSQMYYAIIGLQCEVSQFLFELGV